MKRTFSLYTHQKKEIIKKADRLSIDTELSIKLPENSTAFLVTKFEDQEIIKITALTKKRLWITLLNESYLNNYQINKGDDIGYLIIEPSNIKIYYETKQKINQKTKCPINYIPKNWSEKWKNFQKNFHLDFLETQVKNIFKKEKENCLNNSNNNGNNKLFLNELKSKILVKMPF